MMKYKAVIISLLVSLFIWQPCLADSITRKELREINKTGYIWATGGIGFETCRIITDSLEDIPDLNDIKALCDPATAKMIEDNSIYLYYVGSYEYKENELIDLPPISVITNYQKGEIIITAWDSLEGHSVTEIGITINGMPVACNRAENSYLVPSGLACTIPAKIPSTIIIKAYSDYGDSTKNIYLRIGNTIYSDLIFSHYNKDNALVLGDSAYTKYDISHDIPMAWGVLPGDPIPNWLKTVPNADLYTSDNLYYLSGQLLAWGFMAAPGCEFGGVIDGYSTNCGLLSVYPLALSFQNKYNENISQAAKAWGVPNTLVKRVIAVESQFFPTALGAAGEIGLYQLTVEGTDTILRWDLNTYLEVCSVYFNSCQDIPYDLMDNWQQELLIYHILTDNTNINYLAAALSSNAYQVKQLFDNVLDIYFPGDYFSYDEMWKLTIVNYHVGGQVTAAILEQLKQLDSGVNWDNYLAALGRVSPSGIDYLNMITRGDY